MTDLGLDGASDGIATEMLEALKPFANAIGISFTCDEGDTMMVLRYRSGEPTGACLNSLQRAKDAVAKASTPIRP